ncbi:type IV toxin-antitoxin system AbiEi family antitoxin domain-containing protein [Nocardiopsis halophila]|uniref:type IV toxin-antitoxin system AbiEi family antitoxin domain-containing protein n=1 Tax=Nocardiopsis halophila TaxID=141692 RepID=UPI00037BE160|nr:type IV toxin-antitoxin system AbiEi family antitoxin domain-containing protein [Nocardiopsis halophila]
MRREDAAKVLAEYATDQWGLVTAAQAKQAGVSGVTLLRLVEAEVVERVGRGVYLVLGAAPPQHLDVKVAWLRLDPARPAWERTSPGDYGGIVSHASACLVHDLGDIPTGEVELSVERRRSTRESGVRLRVRPVAAEDVTVIDGLPVTRAERTIADLLEARTDGGHVGGVIADAEQRGLVDPEALAERVRHFATTYGLSRHTRGQAFIEHLVEQAGRTLHAEEVARAAGAGYALALAEALSTMPLPPAELRSMSKVAEQMGSLRRSLSPPATAAGMPSLPQIGRLALPNPAPSMRETQAALARAALRAHLPDSFGAYRSGGGPSDEDDSEEES